MLKHFYKEEEAMRHDRKITMFISIMEKDQETFEKELFKLSLEFGTIEIAKKETIQYLRQPGVKDW